MQVMRSYSRKSDRKQESSKNGGYSTSANGGAYAVQVSACKLNIPCTVKDVKSSRVNRVLSFKDGATSGHLVESRGGGSSHVVERSGSQAAAGGFSESSTYETREHFERKVARVKKTRSERERERSRSLRRGEVRQFKCMSVC